MTLLLSEAAMKHYFFPKCVPFCAFACIKATSSMPNHAVPEMKQKQFCRRMSIKQYYMPGKKTFVRN